MPRKRSDEVVVDPVAAAEQLGKQEILEPAETPAPGLLQRAAEAAGATAAPSIAAIPGGIQPPRAECALGHANAAGTRFCGECGIAMDAPAPVQVSPEDARPRPVSELTDAERAERERQHTEAIAAARAFENAPVTYMPTEGEAILIHFIEDGLTFAGQVWFRGQEIEIGPGHPRWEQARGWVMLDRMGQIERWGKQFFERGPWPGRRSYLDGADGYERLSAGKDADGNPVLFAGPGEQALRQADEAERRRGRAVPAPLR